MEIECNNDFFLTMCSLLCDALAFEQDAIKEYNAFAQAYKKRGIIIGVLRREEDEHI